MDNAASPVAEVGMVDDEEDEEAALEWLSFPLRRSSALSAGVFDSHEAKSFNLLAKRQKGIFAIIFSTLSATKL